VARQTYAGTQKPTWLACRAYRSGCESRACVIRHLSEVMKAAAYEGTFFRPRILTFLAGTSCHTTRKLREPARYMHPWLPGFAPRAPHDSGSRSHRPRLCILGRGEGASCVTISHGRMLLVERDSRTLTISPHLSLTGFWDSRASQRALHCARWIGKLVNPYWRPHT
jgi:hypothetical protein